MTIDQLIDLLSEYRDEHGPNAEVRLMTRQNWPFENSIAGVTSGDEINDTDDDDDQDVPEPPRVTRDTKLTDTDKRLREIFRTMDADQAQEVRESYYKAMEGLRGLADALEIADAEHSGDTTDLLIGEHLLAVQALDAMKRSELGRVL
jgi:hypothetical protein